MEKIFITELTIRNVRHLKDIRIPLSDGTAKHLILTGKNGSGKTSVLEALSRYLNELMLNEIMLLERQKGTAEQEKELKRRMLQYAQLLSEQRSQGGKENGSRQIEKEIRDSNNEGISYIMQLAYAKNGVEIKLNQPFYPLIDGFRKGQFILAYYKAERIFYADKPGHIEKIDLKDYYTMEENPREEFIKYLSDLKVTEALARAKGKNEKADAIRQWFGKFQKLLRRTFDDPSLELIFEEDTFSFSIKEKNREIFDFNTLASGYAAILDIMADLMMRMMKNTDRSFDFNMPGIVLIDEIETHLHLELQKSVLDILTTVFPNIQFIMSTHSPFILNSLENAVIYDLEKKMIVENGLTNIPYSGIVEGYFKSSEMSDSLKEKFERYKVLTSKQDLSDDDFEEIVELEMFLDEIPDFLALGITTEYQRIKMEFESREDI